MTVQSAPSLTPLAEQPPLSAVTPLANLPPFWSQLEEAQRRQLARWLAELIRRMPRSTPHPQEAAHDQP